MTKKTSILAEIHQKAQKIDADSAALYDFEVLLDGIKDIDEKKKLLWKQIYRNAVDDRSTAAALFTSAYAGMGQSSTDHITMGSTLIKYLEKMAKSNQQLIELSGLIAKDDDQHVKIDQDALFKEIEESNG